MENTAVWITQKNRGKKGKLTKKMKRSPDERHIQTHGKLIETYYWVGINSGDK